MTIPGPHHHTQPRWSDTPKGTVQAAFSSEELADWLCELAPRPGLGKALGGVQILRAKLARIAALCRRYRSPASNVGAHSLAAEVLKIVEE